MIICVCKAVSDSKLRGAVRDGRAVSLRDLTRELGLGTCCGKCVPAARTALMLALNEADQDAGVNAATVLSRPQAGQSASGAAL